jgi:nicotinamidase-related amidase
MLEKVSAEQYPWPIIGPFDIGRCALLNIDWQVDYCAADGFFADIGLDTAHIRSALGPVAEVLAAARAAEMLIVHTREGYRADLSDCPPTKVARAIGRGHPVGREGRYGRLQIRGEPGWQITDEVAPLPGEWVVDKPGHGAFHPTDLDQRLRIAGIDLLVITGTTADCCVSATVREANDRGYDCLVLTDCIADVSAARTAATVESFRINPLGATTERAAFLTALG